MKYLLASILFLGLAVGSNAITVTPTGTEAEVSYDEPTTNSDGSVLQDLDHTTIYYDIGQGPVIATTVTATSPTGGGTITQTITIPLTGEFEVDLSVWATASDGSDNESENSQVITVRIDTLAPAAPQ